MLLILQLYVPTIITKALQLFTHSAAAFTHLRSDESQKCEFKLDLYYVHKL
jgi:hypothetical protein